MNRTQTLILAAAAVVTLTACGDDTANQAADAPPAATSTPTASPSAEPTGTPTAEPSTTPTTTPTTRPTTAPTAKPTAASIPGFLAGTDLPKHPTSAWFAGKVTAGQPEYAPFCLEDALKGQKQIWSRAFGTEFDTHATQVVVRTASEADAQAFMDVLAHAAALCVDGWLAENPGGTGDSKDYGAPTASTHIYGVHTSIPDSEPGVHLYGIGYEGNLVTVTQWAQMGDLSDAPIDEFEKTTTTSVDKLS